MNPDELNRIKDAVLLTVAEQMGLDPFDLTVADRKRCDLTVDAALPLLREQIDDTIEKHTAYLASRQHLEDDIGSLRWQLQALRDRITVLADEWVNDLSAQGDRIADDLYKALLPAPPAEDEG